MFPERHVGPAEKMGNFSRSICSLVALSVWLMLCACSGDGVSANAVSTRFGHLNVAKYNEPVLQLVDDGLLLSAFGGPAGVYFSRMDTDGQKTYRVSVSGDVLEGSPTLRIRIDGAEPTYISLTQTAGSFQFEYAGVSKIELLVYSDVPFRYHLKQASIEQCADCIDVSARLGGVEIAPFNDPRARTDASGLTIAGKGSPSGLFIRKALRSNKVYRVIVRGEAEEGSPTLRIRRDDSEPSYADLASMGGGFSFDVSDADRIELLFYADHAYRYRFHDTSIEVCESCVSAKVLDDRLKSRIVTENPGLARALTRDTPLAARILTGWVAHTADLGDSKGPVVSNTALIELMSPGWIQTAIWDNDNGGAFCQGFATYLDKVFKLFGIRSFVVTVGYAGTSLTHVTNVVILGSGHERRYFLFDPTFNGTFVDARTGAFADLGILLGPRRAQLGAMFRTKPISRTLFVSPTGPGYFSVLVADGQAAAKCAEKPEADALLTCREVSYGTRLYRAAFQTDLDRMQVDPNRILETLLVRGGVLSALRFDSSTDAKEFGEFLDRHAVPHG